MGADKSPRVAKLDAIQAQVHERCLKPAGFRKRGRTHNRWAQDGICHVVNFQMGSAPHREDWGFLWVNLGVRIPDPGETPDPKRFFQEYECRFRVNLLSFVQPGTYRGYNGAYFTLDAPPEGPLGRLIHSWRPPKEPTYGGPDVADQIIGLLEKHGLPMFASLSSAESYRANVRTYDSVN